MAAATHLTLRLIRFDKLVNLGDVERSPSAQALWSEVAADTRAARAPHGTSAAGGAPQGSSAYVFAAVEVFADGDSATASFDAGAEAERWAAGAAEAWTGLLQPFRHHGTPEFPVSVNWLDRDNPGPIFACGKAPAPNEPFAVLTTAGWKVGPDLDMDRVADFGNGVGLVRDSMAGVDGLHSQQSFIAFAGSAPLVLDVFTLTFWRDVPAMRAFAYGPGTHKEQMDRFRELKTADRASFTELRVLDRSGSWCGSDPLACW